MDDYFNLDPDDIPDGIAEEMTDSDWQKNYADWEKEHGGCNSIEKNLDDFNSIQEKSWVNLCDENRT